MTADALTGAGILVAVLAGVVSFASPCCLPLVPVYVSYLLGTAGSASRTAPAAAGLSGAAGFPATGMPGANVGTRVRTAPGEQPPQDVSRLVALRHALVFVAGFTAVFVALWASVGLVGYLLRDYVGWLRMAGGVVLILFGLHTAGLVEISALYRDIRLPLRRAVGSKRAPGPVGASGAPSAAVPTPARPRYLRSLLLGVVFAGGWTPCVGPILGGIIGLASASQSVATGTVLLIAYALGLGIPFVLVALGANEVSRRLRWLRDHQVGVGLVTGAALILTGFLMMTNLFVKLSAMLPAISL